MIKDHWVRDLDQDGGVHDLRMIHEVRMMDHVKDINGVPKLYKAWVVEIKEEVLDNTTQYHEERYQGMMQSLRTHV